MLLSLLLIAGRWLWFEFKLFLAMVAPEEAATTIQIGSGWWPSAAARGMGCECLCSGNTSLKGDLVVVMAAAEGGGRG